MKITWLGHSALKIEGSKTVYIDPFISGNPACPVDLKSVTRADAVVVTHDHGDHLGDAHEICKKTGASLFAVFEIAQEAAKKKLKVEMMNVGGTVTLDGISVSLVPAIHTCSLGGTAVGAIVQMDGKTVYHTGDTGLTMDMQLTGELFRPDIVFLPIDGRFNMTPRLAAKAVEFINVPKAVPIHYNTFPAVHSSPESFKEYVGGKSSVIILKPGESVEL